MNKKEAKKVINVVLKADGHCEHCAGNCLKEFIKQFPEYTEFAVELYEKEFGSELDLDY